MMVQPFSHQRQVVDAFITHPTCTGVLVFQKRLTLLYELVIVEGFYVV